MQDYGGREAGEPILRLDVDESELRCLVEVAHQYERAMGWVRYLVVATSPRRIRRRYRHIVEESAHLEQVARLSSVPDPLTLSIVDAVGFWGRLLSNLRSRRTRRRLSAPELELRDGLASKFAGAMRQLHRDDPHMLRPALETRPRRELAWMLEELERDQRPST